MAWLSANRGSELQNLIGWGRVQKKMGKAKTKLKNEDAWMIKNKEEEKWQGKDRAEQNLY